MILSAIRHIKQIWWISFLLVLLHACTSEEEISPTVTDNSSFQTKNVIIVVIDGPRYSETWDYPSQAFIPNQSRILAPQGVLFTNFYNRGVTFTVSGHSALTTGVYQNLRNGGQEFPHEPSIFQKWLAASKLPPEKTAVITSKKKLYVLSNTSKAQWRNRYLPYISAGTGTKSRQDTETFAKALKVLEENHPRLVLIQLMGPDVLGHQGNWTQYLNAIYQTDSLINEIWSFLQSDPLYRDESALFITNDHGRHLDGVKDGFTSHGDFCLGCQHISLLALGPDFKQGVVSPKEAEQVDLPTTIAYLMGFNLPQTEGRVLTELFLQKD